MGFAGLFQDAHKIQLHLADIAQSAAKMAAAQEAQVELLKKLLLGPEVVGIEITPGEPTPR